MRINQVVDLGAITFTPVEIYFPLDDSPVPVPSKTPGAILGWIPIRVSKYCKIRDSDRSATVGAVQLMCDTAGTKATILVVASNLPGR